jgi:protocatechuate 3,4-dioxygenase beta subunit
VNDDLAPRPVRAYLDRMRGDDETVGRVLTRREILAALGATGILWLARCSGSDVAGGDDLPSGCAVRPELTEGPYYVDEELNRSDIRADPATGIMAVGAPLDLRFNVSRIAGSACVPLVGAVVDVWHCDALGVYSDVQDPGFDTLGQRFLRGFQITDSAGGARFTTIYPGWYQGRAVHIHFKVRSAPEATAGFEFTSQLFFDDELTDQVHSQEPYSSKGQRDLRNAQDGIFNQGDAGLVLDVASSGEGYTTTFGIALQDV